MQRQYHLDKHYIFKESGKVLFHRMDAVIVVADTGKQGLTKEAVTEVKELWAKESKCCKSNYGTSWTINK